MFIPHGRCGVMAVGLMAILLGCGEGEREQAQPTSELGH